MHICPTASVLDGPKCPKYRDSISCERGNQKLRKPRDTNQSPVNLSVSGDIVVWWDTFWRDCDLRQDTLFTIPTIPRGWENVSTQPYTPVKVRDDQLYWSLTVGEQVYHFTAPIMRDE
jgi:hypothetical protein